MQRIALALVVSTDKLLGLSSGLSSRDRAAFLRLVRRPHKIEQLPPAKKKAIIQILDMTLQSRARESSH